MQYKDYVPIYPYLICDWDEIVRAYDRHRNETVTLRKHVTKYHAKTNYIHANLLTISML